MNIPKLQELSRAIPDRQGCSEPEKRVLDALAQGMQTIEQWAEQMRKALDDIQEQQATQAELNRAEGSGSETRPAQEVPRYKGTKSIELLQGNVFQFKNDDDPGPRQVYCTNASGERGWLSAKDFIAIVLGEDLDTYMNTWISNYIQSTAVKQYVCTGTQYDESSRVFSQVFVELQILGVVAGSQIVGNVFVAEDCP